MQNIDWNAELEEMDRLLYNHNRTETRRHTQLSTFTYEDRKFFDSGIDIEKQTIQKLELQRVLSTLTEYQRYLILQIADGYSYTELAKLCGKSEGAIRRMVGRIREKLQKVLTECTD